MERLNLQVDVCFSMILLEKWFLKKKGKNRWGIKIKESGKMKGKLTKKYTVLITTKAQTGRQERS